MNPETEKWLQEVTKRLAAAKVALAAGHGTVLGTPIYVGPPTWADVDRFLVLVTEQAEEIERLRSVASCGCYDNIDAPIPPPKCQRLEQQLARLQALHSNDTEGLQRELESLRSEIDKLDAPKDNKTCD